MLLFLPRNIFCKVVGQQFLRIDVEGKFLEKYLYTRLMKDFLIQTPVDFC